MPPKNSQMVLSAATGDEQALVTNFSWDGRAIASLESFKSTYAALGDTEQQKLLSAYANAINNLSTRVAPGILQFDDFLTEELRLKGISREEFLADADQYMTLADTFRTDRDKREESIRRLDNLATDKRGLLFRSRFLTNIDSNNGRRVLSKILEENTPTARAIQILNFFIIQEGVAKFRGNRIRGRRFVGLSNAVLMAADRAMKRSNWAADVTLPDSTVVNMLRLRASACGLLLLRENWTPMPEFGRDFFDDEEENWLFVVKPALKFASQPEDTMSAEPRDLTRGPGPGVRNENFGTGPNLPLAEMIPETAAEQTARTLSAASLEFSESSGDSPLAERPILARPLRRMNRSMATLADLQFETKGLRARLDSFPDNLKELVLDFFVSTCNRFENDNAGEDPIPTALETTGRAVRQIQWLILDEFAPTDIVQFFDDYRSQEPGLSDAERDYFVLREREREEESVDWDICDCSNVPQSVILNLELGERYDIQVSSAMKTRFRQYLPSAGIEGRRLCDLHIRSLSVYCGLNHKGFDIDETIEHLELLHAAEDVDLFLIHPDNQFFVSSRTRKSNLLTMEASLGAAKFRADPEALKALEPIEWNNSFLSTLLNNEQQEEIEEEGSIVMPEPFGCRFLTDNFTTDDGAFTGTFLSIMRQEAEMYLHHFRPMDSATSTPSCFLYNMMFSLTQQVLRMHHGLYLSAMIARSGGTYQLMAYPEPPQLIGLGLHNQVVSTKRDASAANKEIPIFTRGPGPRVNFVGKQVLDYQILPIGQGPASGSLNGWVGSQSNVKLTPSAKKTSRWTSWALGSKSQLARMTAKLKRKEILRPITDDSDPITVMTKQGHLLEMLSDNSCGTGGFMAFCNNYTAIRDKNTLENETRISDLVFSVSALEPPPVPRWINASRTTAPFKAAFHLENCGSLSEAIVGRRSWTDPSVMIEVRELFLLDKDELKIHLAEHNQELFNALVEAWTNVTNTESLLYGLKSWGQRDEVNAIREPDALIDEDIIARKFGKETSRDTSTVPDPDLGTNPLFLPSSSETPRLTREPGPRVRLDSASFSPRDGSDELRPPNLGVPTEDPLREVPEAEKSPRSENQRKRRRLRSDDKTDN
ncbi:hypothetical protein PZA11_006394 [Diplocarpon coronariae]